MRDAFFTERKLALRVEEAAKYRYRDIQTISWFYKAEDKENVPNPVVLEEFDENEKFSMEDIWRARDGYLWLHRDIMLPKEWSGRKVLGFFDFGRCQMEEYGKFEAMCYLDKAPYTGVDQNHREVFFKEEALGKPLSLTLRLWSGLGGGTGLENDSTPRLQELRFHEAYIAWLDEKADDFYYLGDMILQTIRFLDEEKEGNATASRLRCALDSACRMIDWANPGSEEFYASLYAADDALNEAVDVMEKNSPVKIRAVGHTHIDMAWLWRLKHTHEKGSRSFATVLRMMEMFPEYLFLQTQPQLYAYIKEDFPELYEQIKERIKEGRWEADGAMWVEADCNLTSGESLTRQILQGTRFFEVEFGKTSEFLWLPDVFGYSWALPQILKKSGIDTFMTTKISWNQYNRMPHDTFMWKGMDGTEILTHFITTPDPTWELGKFYYTYNGTLLPETVQGIWDTYKDKDLNRELLICYGHGDGGGGVNRDMLERRRRINRLPGMPELTTSTAGEYFRSLQKTVSETEQYVHTWDGELYLEFHRGTYTSQAYNKRMNRKMELLYRRAEWLLAVKGLFEGSIEKAEQEELTEGWKLLLTNQFHDIIPGSSIREVYEDSREDYKKILEIGVKAEESAAAGILKENDSAYTVFNASGWELTELVELPVQENGIFTDKDGRLYESQRIAGGTVVKAEHIPQMGCRTLYFRPSEEAAKAEDGFSVKDREVETPFYTIHFNEAGQIDRLYDKEFRREVLPKGERANVLQIFEDKPLDFEAWNTEIYHQEKMKEITDLKTFEVTELGNLRMVLRMEWHYGKSVFVQDMVLYRDDRRIDFKTVVDFHERHQLVKVAFPTDIRTTYGTYDIQYGNVRRPNNWNTSWEMAKFESVAHRFVDLSERDYGVSLLNDCKYGYDVKENVMRLSLIKAATYPDYDQDQGEHIFTYALLPHGGDFVEGKTVEHAYQLNDPMKTVKGESAFAYESFFTLDNPAVEVDAVKKSEDGDGLIIRFHEYTGSRREVELKPGFSYKCWAECNLLEKAEGEFKEDGIKMEVRPYEIKTVILKF